MPTLVLDEIKGAELEQTALMTSYTRMGHLDEMDLADHADPDALVKVLPYLPAMYTALSGTAPNLKLARIRVKPSDAKLRRVNLELTYETLVANFTPTVYLLRDRSYSAQKKTCLIPGTRTPIIIGFGDPAATTDSPVGTPVATMNVTPDFLFFDINVTIRSIQLTILQYGRPEGGAQNYVNYVNNAAWPTGEATFPTFQSNIGAGGGVTNVKTAGTLPTGYWRLANYGVELDRNKGMALIQSEAITQTLEDWSEIGMLRNQKTGKFPFASLDTFSRLSVLTAMLAHSYSYGIISPPGAITAANNKGIVRFGPYPMTSFPALFGW